MLYSARMFENPILNRALEEVTRHGNPTEAAMRLTILEVMKRAGTDKENPAAVYCFIRTGRLVTEENRSTTPAEDLAEWDRYWKEYEAQASGRLPPAK